MDDQDASFLHDYRHYTTDTDSTTSNTEETTRQHPNHHYWLKHQKWVVDHPRRFQGTVVVAHLAVLLSLPPVLLRRGAPYVPTLKSRMDIMFDKIARHYSRRHHRDTAHRSSAAQTHHHTGTLVDADPGWVFLDLGSGDGRVVFRAAREGIFRQCIGYEINPVLYLVSQVRRLLPYASYNKTRFVWDDIWKIDRSQVQQVDVVAVYGLGPIMAPLEQKLQAELRPGTLVVSNEFTFPNWIEEVDVDDDDDDKESKEKERGEEQLIHVYKVPFREQS